MVDFNKNFTFTVFAVCLISGFHHGYHLGITNNIEDVLEEWIMEIKPGENATLLYSVAVSMLAAGAILGSSFTNSKMSCQKILFYNGFLSIGCQIVLNMCREAKSFVMLAIARFLIGVTVGVGSVAGPLYLSEISSAHLRGFVVTIYQFFISMSIFYAQIFGLREVLGTKKNWMIAIMVATIPSAIGTLLLKFCPESPRHLVIAESQFRIASINLTWLKGSADILPEFDQLMRERESVRNSHEITIYSIWTFPLLVCFFVVLSEQLCGISILIYYSSRIFGNIGFERSYSEYATLSMGASMLVGLMFYMALVEYTGRRILFLISLGSLFFITILLTTALLLINYNYLENIMKHVAFASVLLFGFMYGIGVGPSRWLIISETFNFTARPLVASLVLPCNFLINAVVAQTFMLYEDSIRYYMFIPFIICDLVLFIFAYFRLPETLVKHSEEPETEANT